MQQQKTFSQSSTVIKVSFETLQYAHKMHILDVIQNKSVLTFAH